MSATPDALRVVAGDGKYTVVQDRDGQLFALRHGKPWRVCVGDNLILALAQEVENLRARIVELQSKGDR